MGAGATRFPHFSGKSHAHGSERHIAPGIGEFDRRLSVRQNSAMPGKILGIAAAYSKITQHAIVKGDQRTGAISSAPGAPDTPETAGNMLKQRGWRSHDFLLSMNHLSVPLQQGRLRAPSFGSLEIPPAPLHRHFILQ